MFGGEGGRSIPFLFLGDISLFGAETLEPIFEAETLVGECAEPLSRSVVPNKLAVLCGEEGFQAVSISLAYRHVSRSALSLFCHIIAHSTSHF